MDKKINSVEKERIDLCCSVEKWQKSEEGNSCFCILSDSGKLSSVVAGSRKDLVTILCAAIDTDPDLESILKTALAMAELVKAIR